CAVSYHSIVLETKAYWQTGSGRFAGLFLLLELFPVMDRSKSLYRVGRDPQPQKADVAKGVRQGEDRYNRPRRPSAFSQQGPLGVALHRRTGPLFAARSPPRLATTRARMIQSLR